MVKRFLIILFLSTTPVFAVDDQCAYFKYCGSASTTKKSTNTSTAASINPSNIARIKGLGFEALFQTNNPMGFSMVTGNGKVGAALISSSLDNSFFGVRSLELDEMYRQRYIDGVRYKNNKLSLGAGINVIKKNSVDLDMGISIKRNSNIKKINPGAGFSLRVGIFTIGSYIFKDDVKVDLLGQNPYNGIPYSILWNAPTYQEGYLVKTFTAGVKINNFSLDAAMVSTNYKFYYDQETKIMIYTLTYHREKWMFNYAFRKEHSPNLAINSKDKILYISEDKTFNYFGIQYMANKNFMFGVGYNTFLLNEISGTFTIFLN
ncbi:MAG: hypothetical protein H7336_07830 [Bacteriovorax sp.]|nr:hypothetical protein [Bacteriovorax sp.]